MIALQGASQERRVAVAGHAGPVTLFPGSDARLVEAERLLRARVRPDALEALIGRALPALGWSSLVEVAVTDPERVLAVVQRLVGVRAASCS